MHTSIFYHLKRCTPMAPCKHCKIVSFLRTKLNPEDLTTLMSMFQGINLGHNEEDEETPDAVDVQIKDLNLSARAMHCLELKGITNLLQLSQKKVVDLLCIKNFGKRSLWEVRQILSRHKLRLVGDTE